MTVALFMVLVARPSDQAPAIPKVWDGTALAGWFVPLAAPDAQPVPLSADRFYRLPELRIYKSHPVYAPGREPAGYMEKLRQAEPELAFDPSRLKSDDDWIRAGELVFDLPLTSWRPSPEGASPMSVGAGTTTCRLPNDGTVPFYRYIVREKAKVEFGTLSCGNCHTRVLTDGRVLKVAQGNFPKARANHYTIRILHSSLGDAVVQNA
jgi:hypothetical protein